MNSRFWDHCTKGGADRAGRREPEPNGGVRHVSTYHPKNRNQPLPDGGLASR